MLLLRKSEVLAIHTRLIDGFGGIHGLRDDNALESALTAVENKQHYEDADLVTCSATYAYHLTQAHAFIDGNKRIGAAAAEIFLEINGASLNATNDQIVELFLDIAAGHISREELIEIFTRWIELSR